MTISKHSTRRKKRKSLTFTDLEYSNNNGMITTVWGPAIWHFLHTMSFNYPMDPTDQQKKWYLHFIKSLKHVLPCGTCRMNLRKNFKKMPITMSDMQSRETFSRYIFNLHELINDMLKKPSGLTYEEVRDFYENFRARCAQPNHKSKEKGCTEPIYTGKKPQTILEIVPKSCSFAKSRRHIRVAQECYKRKKE